MHVLIAKPHAIGNNRVALIELLKKYDQFPDRFDYYINDDDVTMIGLLEPQLNYFFNVHECADVENRKVPRYHKG